MLVPLPLMLVPLVECGEALDTNFLFSMVAMRNHVSIRIHKSHPFYESDRHTYVHQQPGMCFSWVFNSLLLQNAIAKNTITPYTSITGNVHPSVSKSTIH